MGKKYIYIKNTFKNLFLGIIFGIQIAMHLFLDRKIYPLPPCWATKQGRRYQFNALALRVSCLRSIMPFSHDTFFVCGPTIGFPKKTMFYAFRKSKKSSIAKLPLEGLSIWEQILLLMFFLVAHEVKNIGFGYQKNLIPSGVLISPIIYVTPFFRLNLWPSKVPHFPKDSAISANYPPIE